MKIFISHKQEDALAANQIASELRAIHVDYYLDLLDPSVTQSGRELTNHIRNNLNNCTDAISEFLEEVKEKYLVNND